MVTFISRNFKMMASFLVHLLECLSVLFLVASMLSISVITSGIRFHCAHIPWHIEFFLQVSSSCRCGARGQRKAGDEQDAQDDGSLAGHFFSFRVS
jgi:hypothetical protein